MFWWASCNRSDWIIWRFATFIAISIVQKIKQPIGSDLIWIYVGAALSTLHFVDCCSPVTYLIYYSRHTWASAYFTRFRSPVRRYRSKWISLLCFGFIIYVIVSVGLWQQYRLLSHGRIQKQRRQCRIFVVTIKVLKLLFYFFSITEPGR